MDPAPPAPTPLRGIDETIVALPYQLGYRPERSLVLIALRRRDGAGCRVTAQVVLTARADLDQPGGAPAVVAALEQAVRQVRPDLVLLVGFEGPGDDSTRVLVAATLMARAHGAVVEHAVRVRAGSRLSLTPAPGCTTSWTRLPEAADVPVVADFVLLGRSPLTARSHLARLLVSTRPVLTAAVGATLARRAEEQSRLVAQAPPDPGRPVGGPERTDGGLRLLAWAVSGQGHDLPPTPPPVPELPEALADLVELTLDVGVRDAVLARLTPGLMRSGDVPSAVLTQVARILPVLGPPASGACQRLTRLAALIPDPWGAPLLALCAYAAWWEGEGTLANLVVDRALQVDPRQRLALLVRRALELAVPPPRPPPGAPGRVLGAGESRPPE